MRCLSHRPRCLSGRTKNTKQIQEYEVALKASPPWTENGTCPLPVDQCLCSVMFNGVFQNHTSFYRIVERCGWSCHDLQVYLYLIWARRHSASDFTHQGTYAFSQHTSGFAAISFSLALSLLFVSSASRQYSAGFYTNAWDDLFHWPFIFFFVSSFIGLEHTQGISCLVSQIARYYLWTC